MNTNIIILTAIAALVTIGVLVATNRLRALGTFAAKGAFGTAAIWGINYAVGFLGLGIVLPGLNFLTVAIVAFLGLPGIIMIYAMGFFV